MVETVAGLQGDPLAQRLSDSFQDHQAAQCGICTPGMMVAAVALLRQVPQARCGRRCRMRWAVCSAAARAIARSSTRWWPQAQGWAPPAGSGAVGTSVRRVDGAAKLAGTERFGDDVAPADALVIRVIRSPHPRAAFTLGDLEAWAKGTGRHRLHADRARRAGAQRLRRDPGLRRSAGVCRNRDALPRRGGGGGRRHGGRDGGLRSGRRSRCSWEPLPDVREVAEALARRRAATAFGQGLAT